jgi:ferredoxin-NADP reductase
MALTISAPRNNFPLHEDADHTVLIAGGIGITPILSMALRLEALGRSFEVIYLARSRPAAAFSETLKTLACPVHWHFDSEAGAPPDLTALLAQRMPKGNTHYYACGPAAMLDAFEKSCAELAYANAHIERFAAVEVKAADDALQQFTVELRKSQKSFEVTADTTLHKQLLATRVLEGSPDHRDMVLSASEQASNQVMMVCVSGCKSERLVLDL